MNFYTSSLVGRLRGGDAECERRAPRDLRPRRSGIPLSVGRERRAYKNAFTLIELMLASLATALILAEVGAMFYAASGQYRRTSVGLAAEQSLREAVELMADDLAAAVATGDPARPALRCVDNAPADATTAGLADAQDTLGAQLLLRVTAAPSLRRASPPRVVDYFLYDDQGRRLLVRRSQEIDILPTAAAAAASEAAEAEYRVLVEDVRGWSLSFHDAAGATRGDWPASLAPALPTAVEIELRGAGSKAGESLSCRRTVRIVQGPPTAWEPQP